MPNDTGSQSALANDASFRARFKAALSRQAFAVLAESTGTTGHATRASYARAFLANPDGITSSLIGAYVYSTNVNAATTAVAFDGRGGTAVTSAVTDLALDAQLQADWNNLSGV
jgi:hypothetical protein